MAVYIGSARHDEDGKYANGAAGDQLQKSTPDYAGEVSMQKFYVHRYGWYVLRAKKINFAMGIAANMITACNNNNIGYDQNQRSGIINAGINTKQKTEADCSTLVRECVKEATKVDPGNFTTLNEVDKLMDTGLFIKQIYHDGMTLYTGDILVSGRKGHTAIVTSGAARNKTKKLTSSYYPTYQGITVSIAAALSAVGVSDVSIAHRTKIAKKNGIKKYSGTATQNTILLNLLKQGKLKKA